MTNANQTVEDKVALTCSAGSYCQSHEPLLVPRALVSEDKRCLEGNCSGREYDGFFVNGNGDIYHSRQCWIYICEED